MSTQLDILALEPFFGGARRAMLETIMRHSRHRWTLLKLPPRRIERRLAVAAHWFAEQLSRHWKGRLDVLFTSEAMNLQDLFRLVPEMRKKPSVVYFHDNQLPDVGQSAELPHHLANLTTANVAGEIWFNSLYHLRTFLRRASSLVEQHPELSGRSPMEELTKKAQLMPPPVDLTLSRDVVGYEIIPRDPRMLFVDTRDADVRTLNEALLKLHRRGEKYRLVTVGPVEGLDNELPRNTISESDEPAQIRALHQSAILLSARPTAASDHHAVRGLHIGCWPLFPNSGVYPELLPDSLHGLCLYDGSHADRLVSQLRNVWGMDRPADFKDQLKDILSQFDAIRACQAMDERLEQMAIAHSI
jgi:hypothetical protein